jgi:hypothetical protein
MTGASGHMNRPGAGAFSFNMSIDGIPSNVYINDSPETGKVEIAKPAPPGQLDELVQEFSNRHSAWAWAESEFRAGRLPLR